jgi:hypothetical protein
MAVSVCIPTYKRHDLLVDCLRTVFDSAVRPLEIVVSDDAHETALAERLSRLTPPAGVHLRYVVNRRGRRQAANVLNAFEHATHDVVVLMHDDDFFLPGGLDALWRAWCDAAAAGAGVDAVFGRQQVVTADARPLPAHTARWNRKYHRLDPGPVPSNLWSALVQQFPMNGMMMRRSLVLAAGVPPEHEVGRHTDVHVAVRYARTARRPFLLIDADVSAYRLSAESIQRSNGDLELDGDLDYRALAGLEPRDDLERQGHRQALDRAAGEAILAMLAKDERRAALTVFRRHWWGMKVPAATRLKLVVLLAGTVVGVRWPVALLRRRRLGLGVPSPRRRLGGSTARHDTAP